MTKKSFVFIALATSFGFGFAFRSIFTNTPKEQQTMTRVTGIGGIFFKVKDPQKFKDWYKTHLGIDAGGYGKKFEWKDVATDKKGSTVWSPFPDKTKYFEPATNDFMINYRVENLEAMVEELKKEGVTILDKVEDSDFGKFVHILDLEGNKIELWEPKG